jgi:hypothetical protein
MKKRRIYGAVLAAVLAVACLGTAGAVARPRHPVSTTSATTKTAGAVVSAGGAYDVSGLDLHDGAVYKDGATYYMVGTQYGCGYQWKVNSNFCGFAVSSSTSLAGPWTAPVQLFSPNSADPVGGTWQSSCAQNGSKGCFNPRMIKRSDGVWILWFNDVAHQTTSSNNAYVTMGCNGPAGPCGATAGPPYGSTHIPTLHQCNGDNGDYALISDSTGYALVCSYAGHLSEEHLDKWLTNGNNTGTGWPGIAGGLSPIEGPGAFQRDDGTWIMTASDPQCGYCSGTRAGYLTAPSMMGPWSYPPNLGFGQPTDGRRIFSATSCGGQPRSAAVIDGQPYEWYDIWYGSRNETNAHVVLDPLTVNSGTNAGSPDGSPLVPLLKGALC